jgi:hypothetical protein
MKTTKTLLIFILMLFYQLTYSQSTDSIKFKRVIISTSLLDYLPSLNLNTRNFNIGSEIYLKNRNSLAINIGLMQTNGKPNPYGFLGGSSLKTQGFKIQVERRRYLNRNKIVEPSIFLFWPHIFQYNTQTLQNSGYYVSAHSFYQYTQTERNETMVDGFNQNIYRNNIYTVDRNALAFNLKLGYQCVKKHGIAIDFGVGLGAQLITSSTRNKLGNASDGDFGYFLFDEGTKVMPSFIYQFRLGFPIK